ncbi:hypothetical protein Mycsm_01870 [Mycobacterium sp. JS623]|nr:hypothetical protein Mycsm_01870 [Mycobacterium sp. JS623]
MDARDPNNGSDLTHKGIEAANPPVDGGDTAEHGWPLAAGQQWVLIDKMANDSMNALRSLAAVYRATTLNSGPI